MRFHQPRTQFYCGTDLHARSMYICVLDRNGEKLLHRKVRNDEELFLRTVQPWANDLTVAVESTFNWYWLADLCAAEGIGFALGHALYMRAIHGAKTKNDRIDSETIGRITLGGNLPEAYAYPRENRSVRDLLRRRTRFVRLRAELLGHIQCLNMQQNNPALPARPKTREGRAAVPGHFLEDTVRFTAESDLAMVANYNRVIHEMELHLEAAARGKHGREMRILRSVPGIGLITAMVIAYETDTVERFATRQQFASYARLVRPFHESGGKKFKAPGRKIGNPYLKWAFSEAAVHAAHHSDSIARYLDRLEKRHGSGRGKMILAHKLGRAVYNMLRRGTVFDEEKFLKN